MPVGLEVADTAIKLGMKATGFDPEITVDAAWRLPASVRRANSVDAAVRGHAGEAQSSRDRYVALSATERQQLLDFLNTL